MLLCSPERFTQIETRFEPDIWALGVIFYEISTLEKPFVGKDRLVIMNQISNNNYNVDLLQKCVPSIIADFIIKILNPNYLQRPNIMEINCIIYIYIYNV